PGLPVVLQRGGGDRDVSRESLSASRGQRIDEGVDLGDRVRMVGVRGVRTDDVPELDADAAECFGHDISRLCLAVDLATVGDERNVAEVLNVRGRVVELPQLFLPPRRMEFLALEPGEEIARLREAGAGRARRPVGGI